MLLWNESNSKGYKAQILNSYYFTMNKRGFNILWSSGVVVQTYSSSVFSVTPKQNNLTAELSRKSQGDGMHFWHVLLIHRNFFSAPVLKDPTDYSIWLLSRVHLRDILLWQQFDAWVIDQSFISPQAICCPNINQRDFLSVTTSILALLFFIPGDRKMLRFNTKLKLMFCTACSYVVS